MSKNSETPMMTQFHSIKESVPDCLLFFRMGDFYEMFGEDAKVASKVLGIALTARNKSSENQIPMCGVPHHSYKQYLVKLVASGYKVAICEQLEDPATAKGLVKRGIVRVVSSGTIIDDEEIPSTDNNFLLAIYRHSDGNCHIAAVDVSTGEVFVTSGDEGNIQELMASFSPKELLLCSPMQSQWHASSSIQPPKTFSKAEKNVAETYKVSSIAHLGISKGETIALDMVFEYVKKAMLDIFYSRPVQIVKEEMLVLDRVALRTLDIEENLDNKGYSLFSVLNKTSTPMGARMLKWWLLNPTRIGGIITERLNMVEFFTQEWNLTQELEKLLTGIYDIERISNRVASKRVSPKELNWLKTSLEELPRISDILESTGNEKIEKLGENLVKCQFISDLINQSIADEPAQNIKEGGIIKSGYNSVVDEFRDIKLNGRQKLADLEAKLKSETGINQLKISYNKVFGYYIEISKGNLSKVPAYFERKQTLVNAERFITPELKELENTILNADDKLGGVEYDLFCNIRDIVAESAGLLRKVSKDIAEIDSYLGLARVAVTNSYCKPEISTDGEIDITDARHPMVEVNSKELFVSNNIYINNSDQRLLIITGPNMAGKSTYIRSAAIITLMAHIGSFVPATKAKISLVDRIFTRVGASDNIAKGESTFMVEMIETANILTHATKNSLIILDEIGRGTSTYDGVSIAWAVSEHILNKIKAKTLFATHYHELTDIANANGAKNYTISVKEQGGNIIFLRKIIEGTADKSYGIYVAKLAGLPENVTSRAQEVLQTLENDTFHSARKPASPQIVVKQQVLIFDEEHPVIEKLKNTDINSLTPLAAFNTITELKEMIQDNIT